MNTNYLMKKKNFHLFYDSFDLWCVKINFSFSFSSDFNLEAAVLKTEKLEALNNCLPPVLS